MFSPVYKAQLKALKLKHEQNKSTHVKQMKSLIYLTFAIVVSTGMIAGGFGAANRVEKSVENVQQRYESRYEAYK